MALFALVFATSMSADIKYDENKNVFYSYPMDNDIDQNAYHILFMYTTSLIAQHKNNKKNEKEIVNEVTVFLKKTNTEASLRLLVDIKKNGFFSYIFIFAFVSANYTQKLREVFAKNPNIKAKDVEEYVNIFLQVACLIRTCWKNGIYGKDIYSKLILYLKKLNTPIALQCLKEIRQ